jgi:hypothetical protein
MGYLVCFHRDALDPHDGRIFTRPLIKVSQVIELQTLTHGLTDKEAAIVACDWALAQSDTEPWRTLFDSIPPRLLQLLKSDYAKRKGRNPKDNC